MLPCFSSSCEYTIAIHCFANKTINQDSQYKTKQSHIMITQNLQSRKYLYTKNMYTQNSLSHTRHNSKCIILSILIFIYILHPLEVMFYKKETKNPYVHNLYEGFYS